MNKGIKKLCRAVLIHANAKANPNKSKDKSSGKEDKSLKDGANFFRHSDEDINAILPRLTPGRNPNRPVTSPMSARRLALLRRKAQLTSGWRSA